MYDGNRLREIIVKKGYKLKTIALELGLSYQGFAKKLNGDIEFKASEIENISNLLNLDVGERRLIFFRNIRH